jgi:ASC-1-like (ASCH) protein
MRRIIFLIIIIFGLRSYSFEQSLREIIIYEHQDCKTPSFDDIKQFFHIPIIDASKELGICTSKIKKICRQNNLKRWPSRKIKKLNNWLLNASNSEKNNILKKELLKIREKDVLKAIEYFENNLSKAELNKLYCNRKNKENNFISVKTFEDKWAEQSLTDEEDIMEINEQSNASQEEIYLHQFADDEEKEEFLLYRSLAEKHVSYARLF